ncbi:hypothetical protein J5751_01865 [bacterium]|nr:hypothetical protein [bacterium]
MAECEIDDQVLVELIVVRKTDLEAEIIECDDSIEIEKEENFHDECLDSISHEI